MLVTICPYDLSALYSDAYSGGSFLISCRACQAQWETHGQFVMRLKDPVEELVHKTREKYGLPFEELDIDKLPLTPNDVEPGEAPLG